MFYFSIISVIFAWLAINLVLRLIFNAWRTAWAHRQPWTPEGLLPDAVPFECGTGDVAVLFIHGFNDVPAVWRGMAERFAAQGLRCRAMRLPGMGEQTLTATSLSEMQGAIAAEINALLSTSSRVFIVAHSFGGALTIDALRRHMLWNPDLPIAGAVLLAPLIRVADARCPLLPAVLWYYIGRLLLPFVTVMPSIFPEHIPIPFRGVATTWYHRDRFNAVSVYDAMFRLMRWNWRPEATATETPLLVFLADEDRVVDSDAVDAWLFMYAGPSRRIMRPNVSHVLPLDMGWESIADTTVAFIREHAESDRL